MKYPKFKFMVRFKFMGFPGGSEVKASVCNVGYLGSIPGSGRSPGEGNGTLLQYSCLENPMDGGAWWATVHGVTKSRTLYVTSTMDVHFAPTKVECCPFYRFFIHVIDAVMNTHAYV